MLCGRIITFNTKSNSFTGIFFEQRVAVAVGVVMFVSRQVCIFRFPVFTSKPTRLKACAKKERFAIFANGKMQTTGRRRTTETSRRNIFLDCWRTQQFSASGDHSIPARFPKYIYSLYQ